MRPSTSIASRPSVPSPEVIIPPAKPRQSGLRADFAIKLLVPLLLAMALVMAYQWGSCSAYWQLLSGHTYSSWLPGLAAGYTLVLLGFQLLRTILWACYKPHPLAEGPLPSLTVIIPAYNEGAMVEKAIYSVAAADYPTERLEIICIDDGSRDNTWLYIQRAQKRYPHLVKALRFPENRGKKAALYAGFTRGRGEVFVTVDSDSVIEPDALRHLVAPLQQDAQIGCRACINCVLTTVLCWARRFSSCF